jgi:hypothetical protein
VYLFGYGLRSACAGLPAFSGGPTPSVAVTLSLALVVLACIPALYVGSYCGVLVALFGWFMGLFSTYVYDKDVNKHTQQVMARIAWQVGRFRRCLFWDFVLLFVAYVVGPVRDFKCFFVAKVWG